MPSLKYIFPAGFLFDNFRHWGINESEKQKRRGDIMLLKPIVTHTKTWPSILKWSLNKTAWADSCSYTDFQKNIYLFPTQTARSGFYVPLFLWGFQCQSPQWCFPSLNSSLLLPPLIWHLAYATQYC